MQPDDERWGVLEPAIEIQDLKTNCSSSRGVAFPPVLSSVDDDAQFKMFFFDVYIRIHFIALLLNVVEASTLKVVEPTGGTCYIAVPLPSTLAVCCHCCDGNFVLLFACFLDFQLVWLKTNPSTPHEKRTHPGIKNKTGNLFFHGFEQRHSM
jgi:hypothetical protein